MRKLLVCGVGDNVQNAVCGAVVGYNELVSCNTRGGNLQAVLLIFRMKLVSVGLGVHYSRQRGFVAKVRGCLLLPQKHCSRIVCYRTCSVDAWNALATAAAVSL